MLLPHQILLRNQPNCGCRATRTVGGAARLLATLAILRWRCRFCSRFFGSDGCSWLGIGWLQLRKCLPLPRVTRDVGGPYPDGDAGLHARDLRRNDRREAGIVNNALRPFPIGMNADDGQIGICPLRRREFPEKHIRHKQQREQYSANKEKISRQGHSSLRLPRTGFHLASIERTQAPMSNDGYSYATSTSCLLTRRRVDRRLEFPSPPDPIHLLSNAVPDAVPYVLYAAPDAAPCVLYVAADAAPSQRSGPQRLIPLIAWRALPGRTPPPVPVEKDLRRGISLMSKLPDLGSS